MNKKVPTYAARPQGNYTYEGHPCTIVNDRYGGVYSGGEWVAFPCDPDEVPEQVNGEDGVSMDFWGFPENPKQPLVGRGRTVIDAYVDLRRRVAEYDWSKDP